VAKSQFAIIYRKVPHLLREMREQAGLTQREFAVRVGKTQSWVYKSESGLRRIDTAEFLDWCVGCEIKPDEGFAKLVQRR